MNLFIHKRILSIYLPRGNLYLQNPGIMGVEALDSLVSGCWEDDTTLFCRSYGGTVIDRVNLHPILIITLILKFRI